MTIPEKHQAMKEDGEELLFMSQNCIALTQQPQKIAPTNLIFFVWIFDSDFYKNLHSDQ